MEYLKMNWKNKNNTWGIISMMFHWIAVIAIIGLFALGLWMTSLTYYSDWYKTAPFIHKSIGVLLFMFMLLRLIWRILDTKPKPLPTHKKSEVVMAHLAHLALYTLIFGIILSGYLISTADGRGIEVFNLFEAPALPFSFAKQEDIAGFMHLYLAYSVIALASVHGMAALKHHVIDKDNTLNRMIGRTKH
jgi:cytochrome b561